MQQPNALITRRATCDICQGHGQQWQRQSEPFNEAFNALATLRLSTSRTTSVTRSCSERAIKPQPLPPLLCCRRGCFCPSSGAAAVFVAIPWRLQFRNRFGGKLKLLFVFSASFSAAALLPCVCTRLLPSVSRHRLRGTWVVTHVIVNFIIGCVLNRQQQQQQRQLT